MRKQFVFKVIGLMLLSNIFLASLFSQSERFVKMVGSRDFNCGGTFCLRDCIQYSKMTFVDGNGVFLDYLDKTSKPNKEGYAVRKKGSKIGFRAYCNRDGAGHFSSKITVPIEGGSATIPKITEKNGCVSCWASANVYYYDAHPIEFIKTLSDDSKYNLGGTNICVKSKTADIIGAGISSVTNKFDNVQFYLVAEKEDGTRISTTYITSIVGEGSANFNEISNGQDIYGQRVYFRILTRFRTTYSGSFDIVSGNKVGPFRFYEQLPPMRDIEFERTACSDRIMMQLPAGYGAKRNLFEFRIAMSDKPKDDNVYKMSVVATGSDDKIYLRPNELSDDNLLYYFQVMMNGVYEMQDFQCARVESEKSGYKPEELKLDANPVSYSFNDTAYHITKKGANNGKARLTLKNSTSGRINFYQYSYNKTTWYAIPSSKLQYLSPTERMFTGLLPNRNYYVRIMDTEMCPGETDQLGPLREPKDLSLAKPVSTLVTCHANNTGSGSKSDALIKVNFNGGIGPYTATLYNEEGTALEIKNNIYNYFCQFENYPAGIYTIKVSDRFSVNKTETKTVYSKPEVTLHTDQSNLTCFGDGTGSIQLKVGNKGTTNVKFDLNGVETPYTSENTKEYSGLDAGYYTVGVTNGDGCRAEKTNIQITQPNDIVISPTTTVVAKYGDNTGAIHLDITEGTGDYHFEVTNETSVVEDGSTSRYADIENLPAGYYKIDVTDANGCPKSSGSIHVRQPQSALEITFTKKDVDCHGNATGEIYPVATGGWKPYRFGLNGTTYGEVTSIENIPATVGEYDSVFVIDSAGISDTALAKITQLDELITSVKKVHDLKCFEDNSGAARFNISGGTGVYSISADSTNWIQGDSISGLAANTSKRIFISDENNCISVESVEISQPEKLIVSTDSVTDAFCNQRNGAIQTTATGGTEEYTYHWLCLDTDIEFISSPSDLLRNVPSGQYKLIVEDNNNCKDSLTALISDSDGPELQSYYIEPVSCNGENDGKIVIHSVTGGYPDYEYYINGAQYDRIISGLSEDTYHFRLLDSMGCKIDKYFIVTQPDTISVQAEIVSPTCHNSTDGTLAASASGGNGNYTWQWSNRSTSPRLWKLSAGDYSVTVTDNKGCTKEQTFEITAPKMPTANLDQLANILCTGNTLTLDGGNYFSHKWYRNDRILSTSRYVDVNESGTYVVQILDKKGCVGRDTLELTVSDSPLDATLLVQDSANISEVVEAIDVTWPVPDSIQWFFDSPVDIFDNNDWSQQFSSSTTGVIDVKLRAWYGGCYSDASKTITFYRNDEIKQADSYMFQPLIEGFIAYPNPNRGDFYVEAKLSRVADIQLQILSVCCGNTINIQEHRGLEHYTIPYNFSILNTGIYIIVLKAENEIQQMKVVVE